MLDELAKGKAKVGKSVMSAERDPTSVRVNPISY
jgi:hypothetical protein